MKICFSYCLYGPFKPKYYIGLEENIEYILKRFPTACIYLWFGSDVDDNYFEKYKLAVLIHKPNKLREISRR